MNENIKIRKFETADQDEVYKIWKDGMDDTAQGFIESVSLKVDLFPPSDS